MGLYTTDEWWLKKGSWIEKFWNMQVLIKMQGYVICCKWIFIGGKLRNSMLYYMEMRIGGVCQKFVWWKKEQIESRMNVCWINMDWMASSEVYCDGSDIERERRGIKLQTWRKNKWLDGKMITKMWVDGIGKILEKESVK